MNTPNNKRKRESRQKIEKVFIQLLQTKELNEISVTEICKEAHLNRSTFYANYLDVYDYINDWKNTKDELEPLTELLTTETTVRTTINSENVTLEDTVGNLFYDYGFTPITIIIKDGEMVDGFIGYRDKDSLTELIEENL